MLLFPAVVFHLFHHFSFGAAEPDFGTIRVYSDTICKQTEGNAISIALGACYDVGRGVAVIPDSFPDCNGGQSTLHISDLPSCQPPSMWPYVTSSLVNTCVFLSTNSDIGSAWFTCNQQTVQEPGAPTAVQIPQSTKPGSVSGDPGGLGLSDKIGLGVGLGVGIAGIVIGIITLKYTRQTAVRDDPPPYSKV